MLQFTVVLVKTASAKENGNQFSANENGFGCIQNQSQDKLGNL
jgi:hypothetical protein